MGHVGVGWCRSCRGGMDHGVGHVGVGWVGQQVWGGSCRGGWGGSCWGGLGWVM